LSQYSAQQSASVTDTWAKFAFNRKEPVVFGDAPGTAERASLNLASACAYSEVSNERVLGFAGPMRDNRAITGFLRKGDRLWRWRNN